MAKLFPNSEFLSELKKQLFVPAEDSHKGQNGKVLVIGGSRLFHIAPIWSANAASYLVDFVHLATNYLNKEVVIHTKAEFLNGIVIDFSDLKSYVEEDDLVLLGPGISRGEIDQSFLQKLDSFGFEDLVNIDNEVEQYFLLIYLLFKHFPEKRYVIDAGALQIMRTDWLKFLKTQPILTPHSREFEKLFRISVYEKPDDFIEVAVRKAAKEYRCTILLKYIKDYISDGENFAVVEGGNAGLTKGGTGDVLAGIVAGFYAKSPAFVSAVLGSLVLNQTAEELFKEKGYWYNNDDLIRNFSRVLRKIYF